MLPPIPQRMLQTDETTVGDHFSLAPSDRCFYVWEYTAGQRYDFSPTNQLIANLKIKPTQIASNPRRDYYKQQAITHSAAALGSLVQRAWVEQAASTAADHESGDRLSYAALRAITRIDEAQTAAPLREHIAVVDDVLNSGKHFRVAQDLLSQRFPGVPVIGIFVARCIRSNP